LKGVIKSLGGALLTEQLVAELVIPLLSVV
jgi:ribose 5-phosphate isomerase